MYISHWGGTVQRPGADRAIRSCRWHRCPARAGRTPDVVGVVEVVVVDPDRPGQPERDLAHLAAGTAGSAAAAVDGGQHRLMLEHRAVYDVPVST
jgi:hypothetical protein